MGVHSCTGPMGSEELLTVLLGGELVTRSCSFREEDKHSAWIQSLLITPKTGSRNTQWGGNTNAATVINDARYTFKHYFCHCLTSGEVGYSL